MTRRSIHAAALCAAATLLSALPLAAAGAQGAPRSSSRSGPTLTSRFAIVPTLGAMSPAAAAAEERRYVELAATLRSRILRAARWAPLGDDGCESGALRTFTDDTTAAARARADTAQKTVETLEYLVLQRGVGASLATPDARAMLGAVAAWEAGGRRLNWDVAAGQVARPALAAGLTGRIQNMQTKQCQPAVVLDTARIVVPVAGIAPPTGAPQPVVFYADSASLARARARVLAGPAPAGDFATFSTVRVRSAQQWADWGLVSVVREAARVPGAPPAPTAGGATYLLHRVAGEWRLLAVPRTWF